jgi:hypothetical protein
MWVLEFLEGKRFCPSLLDDTCLEKCVIAIYGNYSLYVRPANICGVQLIYLKSCIIRS